MISPRWPAAVLLALVLAWGAAAGARAADRATYADSVDQALQVLRDARGDDSAAAHRAADILEGGTGQSQREILAELRQEPPDVADAGNQLAALARAARSPAFAPEPAKAQRAVNDILAQPRYSALRQPPSPGDRIGALLQQLAIWLLDRIGGVAAGGFGWVLLLVGAAGLALVVLAVLRSARWRGRPEARLRAASPAPDRPRDRFAEADRLAAAGDLGGAIRALAGAVAAALADERAWELSPLTVRELFSRAPAPDSLRPLLLAFEAAVYGDRPPDAEAYRRAAAAAAALRPQRRAAA